MDSGPARLRPDAPAFASLPLSDGSARPTPAAASTVEGLQLGALEPHALSSSSSKSFGSSYYRCYLRAARISVLVSD